ncbi:hypothetical protein B4Q13_22525, partial [Lacticaseibacillus rhamnosus]
MHEPSIHGIIHRLGSDSALDFHGSSAGGVDVGRTGKAAGDAALPHPGSFPKSAWYEEVQRGFDFYGASGRNDLKVPGFQTVVNYFQKDAPDEITLAPLAEPALEAVRKGTIKFHPERHAQQYLSWLGEKRDWPISRQLWWGHRIPVWSAPHGIGSVAAGAIDAFDQAIHQWRAEG